MAETETLAMIEEIEYLVSDQLQVVSYKWLSRNYKLSSDEAKRLLQEYVQKHGSRLEVIYALSGWLKSSCPSYHIRLVTGPKLAEAQQEFDGHCSIHVYSVQASIPKDPAVLWNAEFIQAEELFKQPFSVDNCLRDNRFCGISNPLVQRNMDCSSVVPAALQTKSTVLGPTKSKIEHQNNVLPQPMQNKAHEHISKVSLKSTNMVKDVKSERNGTGVHDQFNKPPANKEKVLPLPTGKKKADKSCTATGGSLANFWGRASAKPETGSLPAEDSKAVSNPTVTTADAQICTREAGEGGSSDDDSQDITLRRSSNSERSRKRRVVLDFSDDDEFEDAINLASPDFHSRESSQDHGRSDQISSEKANTNFDMETENKSKVKEERATDGETNKPLREDFSVISKCTSTVKLLTENSHSCGPEIHVNKKNNLDNAAPGSPKRRKVLKTRIDERGREVTEVVWEGEETEVNKVDNVATKKSDSNAATDTVHRPPAAKKSSAIANSTSHPTVKGGGKKAGNSKDPKQGNILSFFKRV